MAKTTAYGCLFYIIVALLYSISVVKDIFFNKHTTIYTSFGGRFKFLTILDLYIHFLYFVLCSVTGVMDLVLSKKSAKTFSKLKVFTNFLYTSIVFPVGVFVAITFWGIYAYDRELIFPESVDLVIPPWQNHLMHTLPFFAPILENFFNKHFYHASFVRGVLPTFFLAVCYILWVFVIYFYGKMWVYPILAVLSTVNRAIFFGGLLVFLGFLYKVGHVLNSLLWPNPEEVQTKRVTSKRKPKIN